MKIKSKNILIKQRCQIHRPTKVHQDKKKYNRSKEKQKFRNMIGDDNNET